MTASNTPSVLQPFEIRAELDQGFNLTTGEQWEGIRVRYRSLGSRGKWSTFILMAEPDEPAPTLQQLQDVCERHARGL